MPDTGGSRSRTADESTWQSGDGGFADEFGKEYEDVRGNLRSVGFGRNPKGDRSFFMFYSALDILTIVLKLHCQIVKTEYRI